MTYWEAVLQNAIGCTIGSLLAILASYLIYSLSTKQSRADQQLEKSTNEEEAYALFGLLMQNVCQASETMISNIDEFTKDLSQPNDNFPDLKYIPLNNFKRISELQDLQKLLFAFTKRYPP